MSRLNVNNNYFCQYPSMWYSACLTFTFLVLLTSSPAKWIAKMIINFNQLQTNLTKTCLIISLQTNRLRYLCTCGFFNSQGKYTLRLCYERMLLVTLNGVPYVRVPDVLSFGKISLLQAQYLLSYWQNTTTHFSVTSTIASNQSCIGKLYSVCLCQLLLLLAVKRFCYFFINNSYVE